jgi:hypothetical protein
MENTIQVRLRAAYLRTRLLKGVPQDSSFRTVLADISDKELVARDAEHTKWKLALAHEDTAAAREAQ